MRITKISVKGLFGMFDHEIPLNQESRITIIHGPNGVGKTIVLRMVHGLFNYEYEFVGETPFVSLRIEFSGGESIVVNRIQVSARVFHADASDETTALAIHYHDGDKAIKPPYIVRTEIYDELSFTIKDEIPGLEETWLTGLGEPVWTDAGPEEPLSKSNLLDQHPQIHSEVFGEMPDWFSRIRQAVSVEFIATQRFATKKMFDERSRSFGEYEQFSSADPEHALDYYAINLYTKLNEIHEKYANLLDETDDKDNERDLRFRPFHLSNTYESDRPSSPARNLSTLQEQLEVLSSQVDEPSDRILLEETASQLNLLADIINERFLFKSLEISSFWLVFVADNGNGVHLLKLSSGEQHLFVLYYQLLFETEPDTLVMIDEPELSMNVVWQRNFLKDLQRIIELRKFDVLIATHSPEVIYDKWDWTVALGAKVDD